MGQCDTLCEVTFAEDHDASLLSFHYEYDVGKSYTINVNDCWCQGLRNTRSRSEST